MTIFESIIGVNPVSTFNVTFFTYGALSHYLSLSLNVFLKLNTPNDGIVESASGDIKFFVISDSILLLLGNIHISGFFLNLNSFCVNTHLQFFSLDISHAKQFSRTISVLSAEFPYLLLIHIVFLHCFDCISPVTLSY